MADRIAVIGSNSFSGSHFVDYCLEQDLQVLGISRSAEIQDVFLPYKKKQSADFKFVQADLNTDLDRLLTAIEDFRPAAVVNFAAQSMVAESWATPEHWFQTNCVATVKLHDKLRKFDFLKKYLHVSTPEVYGSTSGMISEDAPMNPSTPYAVSRAGADMSLLSFHKAYKFPVVFSRAANVFGPGQQLYRIVPRAALFLTLGKPVPLHGGGKSVRSFIHIRDVADGTLKMVRQAEPPNIYHFSTPDHYSIREVVEEVCRQMGLVFEDCVEITGERLGKDAFYTLDSAKARRDLGWEPKISFQQGVSEVISWVRNNIEDLKKCPFDYQHKA